MAYRNICALLLSLTVIAGCGKSPASPSSVTSASSLASQAAVLSAMTQATSQVALMGRTTMDMANTITMPCSGGGSMVMTMNPMSQQMTSPFRSSSRIEFHDCNNQGVVINGDPYLDSTMEISFSSPGGPMTGDSVAKMATTGGVRMSRNGEQGRVQMNCTMTVSMSMANGSSPQVSVSSTGTTTFEFPLGSTPVVRPCGPA